MNADKRRLEFLIKNICVNPRASAVSNARRPGFTLVELLVVTGIAMVIFVVGFTLISGTMQTRKQSLGRVRAAENARMFFQLLERDLAAANAGPGAAKIVKTMPSSLVDYKLTLPADSYPAVAPVPAAVGEQITTASGPIDASDVLQFYTKADARGVTDEYVFVRYYVNRKDWRFYDVPTTTWKEWPGGSSALCRAVTPNDGSTTPELVSPDSLTSEAVDPSGALFDGVENLRVTYRRWDPVTKAFYPNTKNDMTDTAPSTGEPAREQCDHWCVTLKLRYVPETGKPVEYLCYSKLFPIPVSIK